MPRTSAPAANPGEPDADGALTDALTDADGALPDALTDADGVLAARCDARPGTVYLLRPDQHVCARWRSLDPQAVAGSMARALGRPLGHAIADARDSTPDSTLDATLIRQATAPPAATQA